MLSQEEITLSCPYCQGEITQPLVWFRQSYFSCPVCAGSLSAGQFAPLVDELDQLFEASVAELLHGTPSCGCGKGRGH